MIEEHTNEVSRREFLRCALAVGGASALSACTDRYGMPDVPRGPQDLSGYPERQHAWNDWLPRDLHANTIVPHYQLLLFLDYRSDTLPTEAERREVEQALRGVERAYERGNGGQNPQSASGSSTEGVFVMLGYARKYFERVGGGVPDAVELPSPERTLERIDGDPSHAEDVDAILLLSGDYAQALLACEQALFGGFEELNGVTVEGSLAGAFKRRHRRSGFKGVGVPAKKLDVEEIPEESPAAMGFKSGFHDNQAKEDRVSVTEGPFAGGSTMHVSRLAFDLEEWYDFDHVERIHRMFSPHHSERDVGEVGEFLAADSKITSEHVQRLSEDAAEKGCPVGHTQKAAAARDDDFQPKILRRSEANTLDGDVPGLSFTSVQREIADFEKVRLAMNGETPDVEVEDPHDDGILEFVETKSRANVFLPPRSKRALPTVEG